MTDESLGSREILDLPALRKLSGLNRPADVRRWLKANGIRFMAQPSGHPVTILAAVGAALYGKRTEPDFTPPNKCFRRKSTRNTAATSTSTATGGTRSRG